jgi:hypothetical protein
MVPPEADQCHRDDAHPYFNPRQRATLAFANCRSIAVHGVCNATVTMRVFRTCPPLPAAQQGKSHAPPSARHAGALWVRARRPD